jgi:hypothetical protein
VHPILVRVARTLAADPALASFVLFALVVAGLEGVGGAWLESALPYTGWAPALTYAFALPPAVIALWSGNTRARATVLGLLAIQALYGVFGWLWLGASRPSPSPYLRISAWRPLWTVGVPLGWLAVLAVFRPLTPRNGRR